MLFGVDAPALPFDPRWAFRYALASLALAGIGIGPAPSFADQALPPGPAETDRAVAGSKSASPPRYLQLRYDEDYSYLQDPSQRTDLFDPLKFVALDEAGEFYLTLGGEARERYEYFHNSLWGDGPQDDDGYLLQRYMLHADLHLGRYVRAFGQLKSGLVTDREGGPRPTDEDQLDFHQGFLEVLAPVGSTSEVMVRLGRQEMAFGSSRLISVREGPNVRQSFDGVRLGAKVWDWRIDGFATRPVETDPHIFDDASDTNRAFWGAYTSGPLPPLPAVNMDFYYLGLHRRNAEFDQGTADEHRHACGTRIWGKPRPCDYNFEAIYEFGTFGDGKIDAWTVASDTGITGDDLPAQPRLGLKANITSGDANAAAEGLQTFNAFFPRGAYFSEAALIGPANHMDLHPSLALHPLQGVTFSAEWDFFWRESIHDGLYGVGLNLVRSGQTTSKRYVGSEAIANFEWAIQRHVTLTAAYSHFFAGPFLEESGSGEDIDYVSAWLTFKF
jgi:hypothetical protein